MKRLEKKVALVTGGASGLGKAIASRLHIEGAQVVITDIRPDVGRETASEGGFHFIEQNVCDEKRWTEVIRDVEGRFGKVDVLVNNAGIPGDVDTPENATLSAWQKIFTVNVESVFLACREVIPAMRRAGGGSIINISSIAALLATPDASAYGASKAAVRHLTQSVAQHCAQEKLNIRCNSVHPGVVRTPLLDRVVQAMADKREVGVETILDEMSSSVPLGGFTRPEDIAAAVAFLASDDARHMTGERLVVDGGRVGCSTYQLPSRDAGVRTPPKSR